MNALIMQRYGCYANIQMNVSAIANVTTTQRCKRCTFDSPGLTSESEGYPGLTYGLRGTTPSVLRFLSVIRHKFPRYTHVFTEKAQHLRR